MTYPPGGPNYGGAPQSGAPGPYPAHPVAEPYPAADPYPPMSAPPAGPYAAMSAPPVSPYAAMSAPAVVAPPPPPGPGVQVPFIAPPTERDRKRMWIGLGIGAAALVLVCVGGLFAIGALAVSEQNAVPAEATTVVTTYLTSIQAGNYTRAYGRLCAALRQQETEAQFARRIQTRGKLITYSLGDPTQVGSHVHVESNEQWQTDGFGTRDYSLVEDTSASALRICGGDR
jgi:hypothetical protein